MFLSLVGNALPFLPFDLVDVPQAVRLKGIQDCRRSAHPTPLAHCICIVVSQRYTDKIRSLETPPSREGPNGGVSGKNTNTGTGHGLANRAHTRAPLCPERSPA